MMLISAYHCDSGIHENVVTMQLLRHHLLKLFAVLVIGSGHMVSMAHLALEQHVRCAAHGEWTHDDQHHDAHASPSSTSVLYNKSASTHGLIDTRSAQGDHDHEHCQWFYEQRRILHADASVPGVNLAFAPAAPKIFLSDATTFASLSYRTAPKQSPPA